MSNKKEYEEELLKQSSPYAYYLKNLKNEERGESIKIDGPLPYVLKECFTGYDFRRWSSVNNEISYVIARSHNIILSDKALDVILPTIEEKSYPDLIYCDHDYIGENGKRHTPFFKPEYSPNTLLSGNYIGDFFIIKEEMLNAILTGNEALLSIADEALRIYAILLIVCASSNKITHVPEILFSYKDTSWGVADYDVYDAYYKMFTSDSYRALQYAAMDSFDIAPRDSYSISIIIPSKDHSEILIKCIDSIKNKARFNFDTALEIIIIDNGSKEEERKAIEEYLFGPGEESEEDTKKDTKDSDVDNREGQSEDGSIFSRYIYEPADFNYSRMCNRAAEEAQNDLLLFLNDDTEMLDGDSIERLAFYASCPMIGAVGCKLYYPESTLIQHIGITNLDCGPTHKLSTHEDDHIDYFGYNRLPINVLAVTGACLMVEKEKYFQAGGFHDKMKVSYNDVDLCVTLYEEGYYNLVLNDVAMYHHESLLRGSDLNDSGRYLRLSNERALFYERHSWLKDSADPFYAKDLIQDTLDFRINVVPEYEGRDNRSKAEILVCKRATTSEKLKFNIEKTYEERSISKDVEDAYVIEGWNLYLKHDSRNYDRHLFLQDVEATDDFGVWVSLMPKYRTDVGVVFGREKHTELAGFVAKIPKSALFPNKKYRVTLYIEHKKMHSTKMVAGEIYEPGRGYFTEDGGIL